MQTSLPSVVLIHGLHQNTWLMQNIARFLRTHGFLVYSFRYYSLKDTIYTHSTRLYQFLQQKQLHNVHLIGHSLGGLVIRQFLSDQERLSTINAHNTINIHKIITLGTPHQGSTVAHYSKKLFPILLGNSYAHALDGTAPPIHKDRTIGVIAGNKPLGLGLPILHYHNRKHQKQPHDGTVYVFETQIDHLTDHITLPVSHTSMLRDSRVFEQIVYFLTHGKFNHLT